jgi:pyruvate dehydrogenase E1 component alpha subunit
MSVVAAFNIEYTRFLDPQGQPTQALPALATDPEQLLALYQTMVLTRVFDAKAVALQRTGKMGTYPSSLGQEAVAVGVGHAMRKEDVLCPAYRETGAQFQRGIKMAEILAYWGGDERGSCFQNNHEDFPLCVPIGTQSLHAAGIATAFKIRRQARVAVMVCGDGATSEGDFYEAINVAGAWQLPIVFVVNNNQWAISVPRSAQTHCETLAQKALAGGFIGEQVDGNDVIAVRYVMDKALAKARAGGGPTLIEAITYRLHDHTTADDANRYRDQAAVKQAWELEPIARLRHYLIGQKIWSDSQEKQWQAACSVQVEQAVQEYVAIAPPLPTDMFDYLYAELPHDLIEQREQVIAEAKLAGGRHHG